MFKIYVLGNPLMRQDSIPLRLLPKLRKSFNNIDFIELDPTENFPEGNLILIDTILNADQVSIITDIDKIRTEKSYSLHDFDLGFTLKLMKKIGKVKDIKIIGIPALIQEEEALKQLKKLIPSLLSRNE
ncbi:MAG: hypothetical protein Q8L27_01955 [archaeon]|nr:hypothetical protein [archaeon]